jgi:alpha-galactosidase
MAAHVSAVPNHQVGRLTPLETRAAVAFFGVFGYELDPTKLSDDEKAEVAAQVAFYKERREIFQRGRFHRLVSPFEGDRDEAAWMSVADDARTAVVGYYNILNRPNHGLRRLRLRGLDPAATYRVSVWSAVARADDVAPSPIVVGGDVLMAAGLVIEAVRMSATLGDFRARLYVLESI